MSVQSVLRGCHEVLTKSAEQHWYRGDNSYARGCEAQAAECLLQAEAVTRLLEELEKEEETSDD